MTTFCLSAVGVSQVPEDSLQGATLFFCLPGAKLHLEPVPIS